MDHKVQRTGEINQSDPKPNHKGTQNEPMNKSEGVIAWRNLQYRIEVC